MTTSKKRKCTPTTKSTKSTNNQLIYVGPTLSEGRLSFSTVLIGIPAHIQAILDKHPWFKQLLVPVDEMNKAIASTKEKGSLLNILYNKAKKEV